MAGYDFTTSVSNAQPAVSRAGEGDFSLGSGKIYIGKNSWLAVVAIVAGLVAVGWFFWGRK